MRFSAVINPEASTLKAVEEDWLAEILKDRFGANGHSISIDFVQGKDIEAALRAASKNPETEAVLAGGGDGTISAAAGILQGTDKALAVLPGGNMNLFARSLAIPLPLEAAIDALAAGHPMAADIGFANERPFIHEFSLGLHPEMIEERDRQKFGSRIGKIIGSLRSLSHVIMQPPRVRVMLANGDGPERNVVTAALAVSNNLFGPGHLPYADRVDGGELGVYIARTFSSAELASLAARMTTGGWTEMAQMEIFTAKTLRLSRRRPVKAAIDGEIVKMDMPLTIRIEPGVLKVIVPREEDRVTGQ